MGKKILILGAGGFIGNHMVNWQKFNLNWVRGVDLKYPEFSESLADDFMIGDLRKQCFCNRVFDRKFDEVYQFAADMGGAGFVFTGENDADIMSNSALINLNVLESCYKRNIKKIFYSSSACIYPKFNQKDPNNPICTEDSAYPALPDSEYGWEKLFSERLYLSFKRNYNFDVKIARYHNVYGPLGTYVGGREKAPAAICRKVAMAKDGDAIEIWGTGEQTRSFLFIDDCIDGTLKLMQSKHSGPFNIGSEEMVSINELAEIIINISGKDLSIKHIDGPIGVMGRNSDNNLVKQAIDWEPTISLVTGLQRTYDWICSEIKKAG